MPMSKRVQVILEEEEREAFRKLAARKGLSLSAWLREAGRERLVADRSTVRIGSIEELHHFFSSIDEREEGVEPDWEQHKAVIERSAKSSETGT